MSLAEIASYLHLPVQDIEKLVQRGKIPHEKVRNRVVFRQGDIDIWVSKRLLETKHGDEKFIQEFHSRGSAYHAERESESATISNLMTPDRINPELGARTRSSVLSEMTMLAAETELVNNQVDLLESLRDREEMVSTAMSGGIALLHPRHHHEYLFEESFIVLGRAVQAIPFGAPDGKLTDLFFLLCCGDDKLHLHALARLCTMCMDTNLISDLRVAETANDMYKQIVSSELTVIKNLKH